MTAKHHLTTNETISLSCRLVLVKRPVHSRTTSRSGEIHQRVARSAKSNRFRSRRLCFVERDRPSPAPPDTSVLRNHSCLDVCRGIKGGRACKRIKCPVGTRVVANSTLADPLTSRASGAKQRSDRGERVDEFTRDSAVDRLLPQAPGRILVARLSVRWRLCAQIDKMRPIQNR